MKKHNILKVILLVVLFVTVCTWIFPTISFSTDLVEDVRNQMGIFNFGYYLVDVFRYFPYVMLVPLTIGMFYGVAYKIPAYRVLLDKIVSGFKGKEIVFLATVMVLIAGIVSLTGLSFGILFIFPFVISVVLLMGYNKLVAASVTIGSTAVGLLGTTLGSNTVYYINLILGTEIFNEMVTKVILLVIGLVLLVYNVILYANKTKNGTDKVVELVPNTELVKNDVKPILETEVKQTKKVLKADSKKTGKDNKKTTKKTEKETKTKSKSTKSKTATKKSSTKTRAYDLKSKVETVVVKNKKKTKIWPFILVFDLVLIILAISTFNWVQVLNIDVFETAKDAVFEYKLFDFEIFAKILGDVNSFGYWDLNYDIPVFIFLATCFLGFIYGLKFDEFIDGIQEGIKKAIKPAIYMFITYLVLIIVTYNPFQLHFAKFFLELTEGLNVITMTIVAMISSVLNIECLYVAQSTLPYAMSVVTDSTLYPLIGVIFQAVYGLMMLVAPTSVVLLGTLTYLDVSYGQWLKHIWKLFLQLLIVLVIIFLVLFLI